MQQDAILKINSSTEQSKETRVPAEPIAIYLAKRCEEDAEFAAQVAQEHKTMDKCFSFVYEQAKKHLNGTNGWIDDNEVYSMAVDYFRLDDEELERKKAEEEEKRKIEKEKRAAEAKEKQDAAVEQKAQETKQKAAKKSAASKVLEGQQSLFEFE